MPDLILSATVSRTLLGLDDLELHDELNYRVSRVFLGGGVTWPLDALVWINYAEDGPLWPEPEIDEGQVRTPACALTLGFDTPYGYSVGGAGCGDLHASYIVRLVPWFDAHRTGFKWCLEGTGKWYDDLDYIDKLGDHRLVAS